jgi:hypothetical protein
VIFNQNIYFPLKTDVRLQGRAITKPPIKKYERQMLSNPFKVEYNREEYISRHLPFIECELFIKLSDSYKEGAPSRCKHHIFINDYENCGDLDINRQLICYSLRNLNISSKPILKINDIVILQVLRQENSYKTCILNNFFFI